jgi:NADH:ubiquinone oxidoreductase subunit 6 (subunit J)
MIIEILAAGIVVSACLAVFVDEAVYAVTALAGTFMMTSLLYAFDGAVFAAVFQFVLGVGTLAVLFLSGETLSEKTVSAKPSTKSLLVVVASGVLLSLPAVLLTVSSPKKTAYSGSFSQVLWQLRAADVIIQGLVVLTVALGIFIVLYEKKTRSGE